MERVECGEPSCVNGINVFNIREGFMCQDVCLGREVNKGLSMIVECGGVKMKALIDTGCGTNVCFKNAYSRISDVSKKEEDCIGCLRGIGELELPILARFEESIVIAGMRMETDEFYELISFIRMHSLVNLVK